MSNMPHMSNMHIVQIVHILHIMHILHVLHFISTHPAVPAPGVLEPIESRIKPFDADVYLRLYRKKVAEASNTTNCLALV
jgi:hypothetical protein